MDASLRLRAEQLAGEMAFMPRLGGTEVLSHDQDICATAVNPFTTPPL